MADFYMTRMGLQFFEGTMPRIATALERIAKAVEQEASVDKVVLNSIAEELSGKEWSPDTLDKVAELVRGAGRKVEDA
jgi:pseudouridine-5'-phosphate glycosidase